MASILDRYGIKEVADVTFYELDNNGMPSNPVLYLDTLKVSTIEQTAENTSARGGKGNPELIMWDYGKEINVTLEDALFSAKSMAIMFGNGQVNKLDNKLVMKTLQFTYKKDMAAPTTWESPDGKIRTMVNPKMYDENGEVLAALTGLEEGQKFFVSFDIKVNGAVIDISADSFPGTYYVTGDTFARSEASGIDEFFQFIIPKAKVLSENTITMEAEGDPSVFNMSLRVLRPADGKMMKLVKYELAEEGTDAEAQNVDLIHNHQLNPVTAEEQE